MKVLILLLIALTVPAHACEWNREAQPFVRVAAGWTGNLSESDDLNYNGLAAQIELGMRFPLTENWQLDAKYGHDSWWFESDDGDDSRDHFNIGLEYVW